ncbi:glycosyltransferase family 87 protein [Devosia naphthalenivorans]|uniref:glycosyltransferase family 87 protein n=1 Tax=Devosia naphthalenivorans TaxID=2082392 RepID=UPI000D3BA93E|nr:glycosyltransferase family 87 protein [Devosia naphthalenivorans]
MSQLDASYAAGKLDRILFWIAAALLTLFSLWVIWVEWPRIAPPHGLWDFGAFLASGRAAAEGLNPYGIYPPLTPHVVFPGFEAWNPNLNPPVSALLFQLFDLAPPEVSFRAWSWISIGLYAATIALLLHRYARGPEAVVLIAWAGALAGFWDTLYLGQIYIPLVLAAVGAWLLLERGEHVWAGVLIGLVIAIKPNFLVWPVLLFLAGHRKSSLVSVGTAAVISIIPVLFFGVEIYRQWAELVVSDGERAMFLTNASLSGFTARAGIPYLGLVLSGTMLLALAGWALWKQPPVVQASSFALVAAVLASPLGWIHYTLFLLPVIVSHWRFWPMWLVAAMLCIPVPMIINQFGAPTSVQLTTGSAYGWALVLCLVTLVVSARRT